MELERQPKQQVKRSTSSSSSSCSGSSSGSSSNFTESTNLMSGNITHEPQAEEKSSAQSTQSVPLFKGLHFHLYHVGSQFLRYKNLILGYVFFYFSNNFIFIP